jgi:hypothetical protein
MKCEAVQESISRYLTDELPGAVSASVKDHLADCASCRDALAFHRSLQSRMDAPMQAPRSLEQGVAKKSAATAPTAWLTRILGDPTMKKILISSTAVTALLAAVLVLTPSNANASTPVEKFNKMRAAITKAMKNGELVLDVTADAEGKVTVVGTLDGAPLPQDFPLYVGVTRDGNMLDVDVTSDIDSGNYSAIRFGKNQNTLVLVPKNNPKALTEIVLDPKSNRPTSWKATKQEPQMMKTENPNYVAPAGTGDLMPRKTEGIHARIKMYVGSNAEVKMTGI